MEQKFFYFNKSCFFCSFCHFVSFSSQCIFFFSIECGVDYRGFGRTYDFGYRIEVGLADTFHTFEMAEQIGRASCRERV